MEVPAGHGGGTWLRFLLYILLVYMCMMRVISASRAMYEWFRCDWIEDMESIMQSCSSVVIV